MAGKFKRAIQEIIEDQLAPFRGLSGPEQLTVVNFINGSGEAMSKKRGSVFITSKMQLSPGANVVAVPLGGRNYYVVGTI